MESDPGYLSDKSSSFDDFKYISFRILNYICIISAAIISANYLYFVLTGQILVKFDPIFTAMSILLPSLLFIAALIMFDDIKSIRKLIRQTDWQIWKFKGKYIFAFSVAFRFLSYAIVLLAISNYFIGFFKDSDISTDGPAIIAILWPSFLAGFSLGINAWNVKMEVKDTIRNRLFSTRLR